MMADKSEMAIPVPLIFVGNAIPPILLLLLRLLTVPQVGAWSLTEDGEPIKTTRLVSTKRFDMGGRVSASGVEIRFSDPRLPSVHALYGIRFASLGGSGSTTEPSSAEGQRGTPASSSRTDRKTNPIRPPAKRRFMHSVAAFIYETPQEGHLHKTTPPPVCPQPIPEVDAEFANPRLKARLARLLPYLSNQSEDCLTLNIYTPQRGPTSPTDGGGAASARTPAKNKDDTANGLPVLIFVHGESFAYGTGNAYDLSLLASYGNLVAVTLNYRLGLLGFLADRGTSTRGNFALFDLQAAVQWVQLNIHRFGGDPKRVTLMGHNHGAALVHLFSISTLSIGPHFYGIQNIVLLDGSASAPWATAHCADTLKDFIESRLNLALASHPSGEQTTPPPTTPVSTPNLFTLLQNAPLSTILELQRNLSSLPQFSGCLRPRREPPLFPEWRRTLPAAQDISLDQNGSPDYFRPLGPSEESSRPTLFQRARLMYGQTAGAGMAFDKLSTVASEAEKMGTFMDRNFEGPSGGRKQPSAPYQATEFTRALNCLLKHVFRSPRSQLADLIRFLYVSCCPEQRGPQTSEGNMHQSAFRTSSLKTQVNNLLTDALFLAPGISTLQHHARLASRHFQPPPAPQSQYLLRQQHLSSEDVPANGGAYGTYAYILTTGTPEDDCSSSAVAAADVCVEAGIEDDLQLLLGEPLLRADRPPSQSAQQALAERQVSQLMMRYLVNFIYSGNPNTADSGWTHQTNTSFLWPMYTTHNDVILQISRYGGGATPDSKGADYFLTVQKSFRKRYTLFWSDLFPKLVADLEAKKSTRRREEAEAGSVESLQTSLTSTLERLQLLGGTSGVDWHSRAEALRNSPDTKVPSAAPLLTPSPTNQGPWGASNGGEGRHPSSSSLLNGTVSVSGTITTNAMPLSMDKASVPFPSEDAGDSVAETNSKRILLLTLVVGLALFLLNVVFVGTFYVCMQQRKDRRSNGILVSASDADNGGTKSMPRKPSDLLTQGAVVKFPADYLASSAPKVLSPSHLLLSSAAGHPGCRRQESTDYPGLSYPRCSQAQTPLGRPAIKPTEDVLFGQDIIPKPGRHGFMTLDSNWRPTKHVAQMSATSTTQSLQPEQV
ncbi:neurexin protein binding [Sparganum proliferum]